MSTVLTTHLRNSHDTEEGLNSTCSSEEMANSTFRTADSDITLLLDSSIAQHQRPNRRSLSCIADTRSGRMGIDVVNLPRSETRMLECPLHSKQSTRPVFSRRRHMIRVTATAISPDFCKDIGTACFGVLEFLQHQNCGTLANDETVPISIKGATA